MMTATAQVAPTAKYSAYSAEVATKLAGTLSARERRRLEAERELPEQARFIELGDVVHHYLDAGPADGEPIVLVHSLGGSAYWWHRIIGPLAGAGHRVICYDLKGHGFSDSDPRRGYTVAALSDDLLALAEALALPAHHLAAFSLGGFVALHYADAHPERVRSLALFNFSPLTERRAAALVPRMIELTINRLLGPVARRGLWWLPYLYALAFLAKNTAPASDARLAALGLRCCDPAAVRVAARDLARREVRETAPRQMSRLERPALLVAGDGDPLMRPQGGRKLIGLAPSGQLLEVPRCGHLILLELPEQAAQILRLFLRGARG